MRNLEGGTKQRGDKMTDDQDDKRVKAEIMNRALEALGEFIADGSREYKRAHPEDYRNIMLEIEQGSVRFEVRVTNPLAGWS